MTTKWMFIITSVIVAISLALMIASVWMTPHMWLSTKLHITAMMTAGAALFTFLCFVIYTEMFKDKKD
jgi:hypothetical protein